MSARKKVAKSNKKKKDVAAENQCLEIAMRHSNGCIVRCKENDVEIQIYSTGSGVQVIFNKDSVNVTTIQGKIKVHAGFPY